MLKGIDHVVIVVGDLDRAAGDYRKLGFNVVPGGRHPVGSHNALIALADGSYIEIISYYRSSPDHRWWAALQKGEGLVDFCLQTDDLAGDTRKLREAGVAIDDPVPWSRTRPDGYELKWLLSLAREGHRGVAPFLIQDLTPRAERVPRNFSHENGAAGIATVAVAVRDREMVAGWYKKMLGCDGRKTASEELQAAGLEFSIGPHRLELLAPAGADSPLRDWIEARGPSPYAATLIGPAQTRRRFDPALTHGARLSFPALQEEE